MTATKDNESKSHLLDLVSKIFITPGDHSDGLFYGEKNVAPFARFFNDSKPTEGPGKVQPTRSEFWEQMHKVVKQPYNSGEEEKAEQKEENSETPGTSDTPKPQ